MCKVGARRRYVADFLRTRRLCDACARAPLAPLCDACATPAPTWRWLAYEDLVAARRGKESAVIDALAAFLDVSAADVKHALAHFRASTKRPAAAPAEAAAVAAALRDAEGDIYAAAAHVGGRPAS